MSDLIGYTHSKSNVLVTELIVDYRADMFACTSRINSITSVEGILVSGVRCFNCQLNQHPPRVKNSAKCFRPARFNKEETIINCNIYKKSKG